MPLKISMSTPRQFRWRDAFCRYLPDQSRSIGERLVAGEAMSPARFRLPGQQTRSRNQAGCRERQTAPSKEREAGSRMAGSWNAVEIPSGTLFPLSRAGDRGPSSLDHASSIPDSRLTVGSLVAPSPPSLRSSADVGHKMLAGRSWPSPSIDTRVPARRLHAETFPTTMPPASGRTRFLA